jgi:CRISPR/Cas system-associated protein Csm6
VASWIIASTSLADEETEKLATGEINIPYVHELFQPPVIFIPVITKPDRIVLMVAAVQYMVKKKNEIQQLNDLKKLPCGVVWAGQE